MKNEDARIEESLDPHDWEALRDLSHRIVDDAIDYVRDVRDRPVWQPMPDKALQRFREPLPDGPKAIETVYQTLAEDMLPYPMGNIHPRFWMWYMGSGNFTGALGDFLAAILGSNLGGGNHAAALIDQQVVDWFRQIVGFPDGASGTLVSGGSMANIIGLTVARNAAAGSDVREAGIAALNGPLRYYCSDQVHSCHQTAMELLGLGNQALRRIPTGPDCRLDVVALRSAIAEDRAAGFKPACVIATAGTVNTGAIDDLLRIASLCRRENLWFHIDGCIGALLAIAPQNQHLVEGIELADSLALDPHKWLHAPFDVGCALVRDANSHRGTFALNPEYLETAERGIANAPWLFDYGVQTSRGFRALKVWMSLQEHGVGKFGRLIDQNVMQAAYLCDLVDGNPCLELWPGRAINIVCYRYNPGRLTSDALKQINTEIMLRMQEDGSAAVSDTTVHGEHFLRIAINNHRTVSDDLEFLVAETVRLGDAIVGQGGTG